MSSGLLPLALDPAHVTLNLSSASTRFLHYWSSRVAWQTAIGGHRASLAERLLSLDLSRAAHLATVGCANLAQLRSARLPPAVRVACFDGCERLVELRPTASCTQLLSLQLDGCRKLGARSLRGELGAWSLGACRELDLSYCRSIDAASVAVLLRALPSLVSLNLRGLALGGSLEAALAEDASALASLSAADFAFSSGLRSDTLLELTARCASLTRCNLRGADGVDRPAYNAIGRTMQERAGGSSGASAIENRRRSKRLEPRTAPSFYYLK